MSALPKPSPYTDTISTPSKRYSSRQKRLRTETRQSQANILNSSIASSSPAPISVNQPTAKNEEQTTSLQPAKFPSHPTSAS